VRGAAVAQTLRTDLSLRTLQEQTIMGTRRFSNPSDNADFANGEIAPSQSKSFFKIVIKY
jgi:hypothetical protein